VAGAVAIFGRRSVDRGEYRAVASQRGELFAQASHERRLGQAFLEQRQRAVIVLEAPSS
jgi:hypothetical protein